MLCEPVRGIGLPWGSGSASWEVLLEHRELLTG